LRIVEEFDDEDKLLFKWEIEGANGFVVVVFDVVVAVEFDDDNDILDGTGFLNEIDVNDDGLTSESIKIEEKKNISRYP
jgi:hypothetical protein